MIHVNMELCNFCDASVATLKNSKPLISPKITAPPISPLYTIRLCLDCKVSVVVVVYLVSFIVRFFSISANHDSFSFDLKTDKFCGRRVLTLRKMSNAKELWCCRNELFLN